MFPFRTDSSRLVSANFFSPAPRKLSCTASRTSTCRERTGRLPSSASAKFVPTAFATYVTRVSPSATTTGNSTVAISCGFNSTVFSAVVPPNVSETVQASFDSDRFVTFTANLNASPSRTKRGGFGSTISGRVVVTDSSVSWPQLRVLSCTSIMSFQPVIASGAVNVNETRPSLSVVR